MTHLDRTTPIPSHVVIDQRLLNGEGPGAYRHELSVTPPAGQTLPDEAWSRLVS